MKCKPFESLLEQGRRSFHLPEQCVLSLGRSGFRGAGPSHQGVALVFPCFPMDYQHAFYIQPSLPPSLFTQTAFVCIYAKKRASVNPAAKEMLLEGRHTIPLHCRLLNCRGTG